MERPASGLRRWAAPVDLDHPGSRDNYRMLETPPDEPIVQIQRVEHESRVHLDIETDDASSPRSAGGKKLQATGAPPDIGEQRSGYRPSPPRKSREGPSAGL
jgi:hypothetical protein